MLMAGFGTDKLPLYWTQPDRRFAFLHPLGQRPRRRRPSHP